MIFLLKYWRIAAAAVLALALIAAYFGWRGAQREHGREEVRAEWAAERAALAAEVQAQAERNRDLQRQSEKRYTVQAEVRERFITKTITEVRHATAALAACPVPDGARVQLNAAASCARGDPASTDCPGEPVPDTR